MQQVGQSPYGPAPDRRPVVQPRPRTSHVTIFIAVGIVVVVILGVGLGVLYPMVQSSSGPDSVRVTANQYYEGEMDRTLLIKVLKNQSYDPESTSPTNSIIYFKPYCGEPGSEEANTSRPLFNRGTFLLNGDNTTIKLVTKTKSNSEANRNMLEDSTNCAFDKLSKIMMDDLNMSLAFQNIDMKKFTAPGFEAALMVPAIVVISLIWRRRVKALKK